MNARGAIHRLRGGSKTLLIEVDGEQRWVDKALVKKADARFLDERGGMLPPPPPSASPMSASKAVAAGASKAAAGSSKAASASRRAPADERLVRASLVDLHASVRRRSRVLTRLRASSQFIGDPARTARDPVHKIGHAWANRRGGGRRSCGGAGCRWATTGVASQHAG